MQITRIDQFFPRPRMRLVKISTAQVGGKVSAL